MGEVDNKYYLVVDKLEDGSYVAKRWTTYPEEGENITLTAKEKNHFVIKGLDEGTYKLKETKAPAGYDLPNEDFTVVLEATTVNDQNYGGTPANAISSIKVDGTEGNSVNLINTKGTTLPETGGMGTTMLYTIGGALVAGSAIFFATNKRMRRED